MLTSRENFRGESLIKKFAFLFVSFFCFNLLEAGKCYEEFISQVGKTLEKNAGAPGDVDVYHHELGIRLLEEFRGAMKRVRPEPNTGASTTVLDVYAPFWNADSSVRAYVNRRLNDLPSDGGLLTVHRDFSYGSASAHKIADISLKLYESASPRHRAAAWRANGWVTLGSGALFCPEYPLLAASLVLTGAACVVKGTLDRLAMGRNPDLHEVDSATNFFREINRNVHAQSGTPARTLKKNEFMWLHSEAGAYTLDVGFTFLHDDQPRFLAVYHDAGYSVEW